MIELSEKSKNLLNIYKEVFTLNKECLLSGSLAIQLQNVKTRRNSEDLDIYLPFGQTFQMPEGMQIKKPDLCEQYEDEDFERFSYRFKSVNIDVFMPVEDLSDYKPMVSYNHEHSTKMVRFDEIMRFKIMHSFGEAFSKYKHKDDLIYSLVANIS